MAMNNWGGITEHMSKKPRKFFGRKRAKRDLSKDPNLQLSEDRIKQADHKKRSSIQKEMIIYLVIFVIVLLGFVFYLN